MKNINSAHIIGAASFNDTVLSGSSLASGLNNGTGPRSSSSSSSSGVKSVGFEKKSGSGSGSLLSATATAGGGLSGNDLFRNSGSVIGQPSLSSSANGNALGQSGYGRGQGPSPPQETVIFASTTNLSNHLNHGHSNHIGGGAGVFPRRNTIPTSSVHHSSSSILYDDNVEHRENYGGDSQNLDFTAAPFHSNNLNFSQQPMNNGGGNGVNLNNISMNMSSMTSQQQRDLINSIGGGGFTGFDNQFSNNQGWSRAFQQQSSSAKQSQLSSSLSSNNNNAPVGGGGGKGQMYGHRNTMPSLNSSPFAAFDGAGFAFGQQQQLHQQHSQQQNGQAGVNASSNGSSQSVGANVTSLDCYLVQFTSGRTDTYYVPQDSSAARMKINAGDYVIVEADRGEDLGRVIMDNINVPMPRRNSATSGSAAASQAMSQFDSTGLLRLPADLDDEFSMMPQSASASNMPKKIYRTAQPVEIESLLGKVRDELNAIAVGHYKVQEWKLPMSIIDAEYQWDRRKLTFFFSVTLPSYFPNQPSPRIDFRTLDLYQIYRTRIWMYCVDKDKNRSNRAHNRENFLKQLNADIEKFPKQQQHMSSAQLHMGKRPNSLKAVLEEQPHLGMGWNMVDQSHGETLVIERDIDLDQLTFGVADLNVSR